VFRAADRHPIDVHGVQLQAVDRVEHDRPDGTRSTTQIDGNDIDRDGLGRRDFDRDGLDRRDFDRDGFDGDGLTRDAR
jgi:hypothetical protein